MNRKIIKSVKEINGKEFTIYKSRKYGMYRIIIYYLGLGNHIVEGIDNLQAYVNKVKLDVSKFSGMPNQPVSIYEIMDEDVFATQIVPSENGLKFIRSKIGTRGTVRLCYGEKQI